MYSVTKTTSKQNIMGGIPARRKDTIFWRQELCRSNLSIGSWLSNVSLRSLRTIVFHDHLFMFAEAIKWWKPNLIAPSKEFQYNLSCLQTLAIFWLDMQWGGELKQDKSELLVVLIAITQQSARSSYQFFFFIICFSSFEQCNTMLIVSFLHFCASCRGPGTKLKIMSFSM